MKMTPEKLAAFRKERADWVREALKHKSDACLIWPFTTIQGVPALLVIEEKRIRPQRLICLHKHGPAPHGKTHVSRTCHNPLCCNPAHQYWNRQGRTGPEMNKGTNNPSAKLKEADVHAIRASTDPAKVLAEAYKVSPRHISAIRKRRVWAWLN